MSKKQLKGKIEAWSGDKTVSVGVTRVFHHLRYRKRVRASKTYLAHLEGAAEVGQNVVIEENRPISKRKHWRVVELAGKPVGGERPADREQPEPKAIRRKRKAVSRPPEAASSRRRSSK